MIAPAASGTRRVERAPQVERASTTKLIKQGWSHAVIGNARVHGDELRKRIGVTAFSVWRVLASIATRDRRTGIVRTTAHDLLAQVPFDFYGKRMNIKRVERALAALNAVGLVDDRASFYEPRGKTDDGSPRIYLARAVRGLYAWVDDECVMPVATAQRVAGRHKGHGPGGQRRGAGRKPGSGAQPKPRCDVCGHVGCAAGFCEACPACVRAKLAKTPEILGGEESTSRGVGINNSGEHLSGTGSVSESLPSEETSALRALSISLRGEVGAADPVALLGAPTGATSDASTARAARLPIARLRRHPAVPAGVLTRVPVAAPKTPPAPMLDASLPLDEQMTLVRRWCEVAVEQRIGVKVWAFRAEKLGGDITRSKYRRKLALMAHALVRENIAPINWFAHIAWWWADKAHRSGTKVTAPPVGILLSESLLAKFARWCESEEGPRGPGDRLVYGPKLRALMERNSALRVALARLDASATDEQISAVVATYFPRGRAGYEAACVEARKESEQLQSSLNERAKRGEWVW